MVDPGPLDEGHLRRVAGARPGRDDPDHPRPPRPRRGRAAARRAARRRAGARRRPGARIGGERCRAASVGCRSRPRVCDAGHTADSVCFLVEHGDERAVLTGDTILGRGTTVVAHPDGDLGDYLDSLRAAARVRRRSRRCPGTARRWPTAPRRPGFYLAHRRARLDAGPGGASPPAPTPPAEVVAVGLRRRRPVAVAGGRLSVRAQLEYLAETGIHGPGRMRLDPP